jgi:integrase
MFPDWEKTMLKRVEPVAPTNLAELIETIAADDSLSEIRRRNLCSSLRRFCQALGLLPDVVPATFWFFREKLANFHPAEAGIKEHRWQTIRSDVSFALKHIGLAPDQPKPRIPLSREWTEFRGRLGHMGMRKFGLSRFIHFCEGRGIKPEEVDDSVMTDFREYLEKQTLKTKPKNIHRDTCLLWNRVADTAPELSLHKVAVPSNRIICTPGWDEVPLSFRLEAEAWLSALGEKPDLLSETARVKPLAASSIKTYAYTLLQAVAGLVQCGRPIGSIVSLSQLVNLTAVETILEFHRKRMGVAQSQMLGQIAHVLVLVAEEVKADEQTVAKLKLARSRVMPPNRGLKSRPKEALRQFLDRENIEKLLILPHRILRRLEAKKELTLADARLMQVAVALELLLMRPIRRGNLVALRFGEHILKVGKQTVIVLKEEEVKNGVAHDYVIPPESARVLDFYVTRLLPLFGSNPQRFLFPGDIPGAHKSGEQLGRFFTKTIRGETGLRVYPHVMRHFGATLYLTDNPEGMEVVRRVLGHRSADTTARSYAGVHDQVAVRRFDEFVLRIRGTILKEIGDA